VRIHRIREATNDDLEFLVEMAALFGQRPDSVSVEGWRREGWDFGLIAEDEGGNRLGAAWWRQFEWDPSPKCREVFLARREEHRGKCIGASLLDRLIDHAWADKTIQRLVGRAIEDDEPAKIVRNMLRERWFTYQYSGGQRYWKRSVSNQASEV
jgi:GNAT superfamily N-acetyltransferase